MRDPIHPWPLRLMHWTNAAAILTMIGSGWQIYDAAPIFPFTFPESVTIGQWLGAAIAWHFAAMWVLVGNGVCYLAWGAWSGHFRRKLVPPSPRAIWRDVRLALTLRLPHRHAVYNAVQRALYLGVLALGVLAVVSGLAVWKPVQLWWLSDLFGGFRASRVVHFLAMAGIVLFLAVHLALVALVPRVLGPMLWGGRAAEDVP
ncbi:MAG: cytochrome b/b6 domain-containing protein [Rhodospirillales bacterium]|nr:cytochrome b/b6 domain-containing protein [Rhodospirillales bacterium]